MLMHRRCSGGFTLIEIMVSIAIFAIAILGMSSLQVRSYSTSLDLSQRAVMAQALQDFSNRVRSNPLAADAYQGTFKQSSCSSPSRSCADKKGSAAASCTAAQMAIYDKWMAFCGAGNAAKLTGKVIDWQVSATCLDSTADCTASTAQMRIVASWGRRRGSTDKQLSGDAAVDVLGTGAVATSTQTDQMVLVFSPW